MRAFFVAISLWLTPTLALASPFYLAAKSEEIITFVDMGSIVREGPIIQATELVVKKEVKGVVPGEDPVLYTLQVENYNCSAGAHAGVSATDYTASGKQLNFPFSGLFHPITPGTMSAELQDWVCLGKSDSGDPRAYTEDAPTLAGEARKVMQSEARAHDSAVNGQTD
ncbi:MAG: hypothetical protein ACYDD1_00240 [Caulobacteraceae bacterium]